nr:uncharacterized protein LOC126535622 [Dermacentor andersoni]
MLSLYSVLKPPRFGNCSASEKEQYGVVTLADLKNAYNSSASKELNKLDQLKERLDGLIDEGSWECDEVFEYDNNDASVVECIIYYVTGFVSRKIFNQTSCTTCKKALEGQKGSSKVPEAELVNCKTRGRLTHPNMHLYRLFMEAEEHFSKYANLGDAYDKTIDAVLEKFTFPCTIHRKDILAKLLHYYISLRMRQYCRQLKRKHVEKGQDLRKMSKLV